MAELCGELRIGQQVHAINGTVCAESSRFIPSVIACHVCIRASCVGQVVMGMALRDVSELIRSSVAVRPRSTYPCYAAFDRMWPLP